MAIALQYQPDEFVEMRSQYALEVALFVPWSTRFELYDQPIGNLIQNEFG